MRIDKLLIFLMVLSIFLDDFIFGGTADRATRVFDFYYYYLIFLSFLTFFLFKEKSFPWLPRWFLKGILLLFILSFIAGSISEKIKFSMFKQLIGIFFSSIAYFNLIKYVKFDLIKVFNIYLRISLWVSIYGLAEEALQLAGFHLFFDNSKRVTGGLYRVYSIMGEPYFLAVALIPALYYYINKMVGIKIFRDRKELIKFGIIFSCFILTFSSAGFIGLALMLVMLAYNHRYLNPTGGRFFLLIILLVVIGPLLNIEMFSIKEMQIRLMDSLKAFGSSKTLDKKDIAKLNSSTFALYSNYLIAQKSFGANPLIGSGIGTHELTYNEYFEPLFGEKFLLMYGQFNAKDGNSLFIRMMSETGIIGLLLFFIYMFKFVANRKLTFDYDTAFLTVINHGVFIVFIIRLVRTGNYISQGFFFFFFLYYFTYKQIKEKNKQLKIINPSDKT